MTGDALRLARPDDIDTLIAIDDDACTLAAEAGLVAMLDASHPFVAAERMRWAAAIARGLVEVAEPPGPFYARHGFVAHPEAACGPELRAILRRQRDVLPAPDRRIAMVWTAAGDASRLTTRESPPIA